MDTALIVTISVCLFILAVLVIILIISRKREYSIFHPAEMPDAGAGTFEERLKRLLNQWKIMEAVKLVRVTKGLGLKESKDFINKFMQETSGVFEQDEEEQLSFNNPNNSNALLTPKELDGKVFELLVKNQKMNAVKLVKENLDIGLKEAKDYVEEIERKLNI